jgi:hypothetical protein
MMMSGKCGGVLWNDEEPLLLMKVDPKKKLQ